MCRRTRRFTPTDLPNSGVVEAGGDSVADLGSGVREPDSDDGTLRYRQLFEDEIVIVVRHADRRAAARCRRESADHAGARNGAIVADIMDAELAYNKKRRGV